MSSLVRNWCAWIVTCACACGDNVVPVSVPLQHSDTLFLVAHEDDDMIFMQPELLERLRAESVTTIYATTAGPNGRGRGIFEAATVAYGTIAGSQAWDCGPIELGAITVQHCRHREHPISLVDFGLPDGGTSGDRAASLLHLFDGTTPWLFADDHGTVTAETVVDVFAHVLAATTPSSIETLELAGSHGRDNSSHMFVASIGLWAAARVGYSGTLTWHRGYNVDVEEPTLAGDDLMVSRNMLAHYEACADGCAPCGTPCPSVNAAHEVWLQRQYALDRVREVRGKLALGGQCLHATLSLGDCADAPEFDLSATGELRVAGSCVTSAATDELTIAPCVAAPEQYWVLDSENTFWNGRPPKPSSDMAYDHVRCLTEHGAVTCGAKLQPRWTILQ